MPSENQPERKLAVILFADIAGYTAMMQSDEGKTMNRLRHYQQILSDKAKEHNGEIVKNYGDGSLCLFSSVLGAVKCAKDLQIIFQTEPKVPLRIGLHIGDVMYESNDIYGNAINVSSRIESMGIPGSVLMSKDVYKKVRNQSFLKFKELGSFDFKNVEEPIQVYALANKGLAIPELDKITGKFKSAAAENGSSFFQYIWRKKISQIVIAYIVIAWLLAQVAAIIFPTFEAPEWVMKVFIFLLLIGFPMALILVWAQGLKKSESKEEEVDFPSNTKDKEKSKSYDPKSIAVLPFIDMSPNKDQEYFSDGMTEEILNLLAGIRELKVIGRTSSFSFKGEKIGIKEISDKLKVAHILEGSVRKSKNKIRVTAQLIKASGAYHIWSQSFDRELTDIFDIQDEIADSIAKKLEKTLVGQDTIQKRQTNIDPKAYELYFKGKYESAKGFEGMDASHQCFEQALVIEPDFALALFGIGTYHFMQVIYGLTSPKLGYTKVYSYMESAIALNPYFEQGFAALASFEFFVGWDWKKGKGLLDKAYSINPNHADVIITWSWWDFFCGNLDEAVIKTKRAIDIDPLNPYPRNHIAFLYHCQRKYSKALKSNDEFLLLYPQFSEGQRMRAQIYYAMGNFEESLILSQQLYKIQDGHAWSAWFLALTLIKLKRKEEAIEILEKIIDKGKTQYQSPYFLFTIYWLLDNFDLAYIKLDEAFESKDLTLSFAKNEPISDEFREDPRWIEVIEKINFPSE